MAKLINLYDVSDTCIWDIIYNWQIKRDQGQNLSIDDLSNDIVDYLYNDVKSVNIDECDLELVEILFKSDLWFDLKEKREKQKIEYGE